MVCYLLGSTRSFDSASVYVAANALLVEFVYLVVVGPIYRINLENGQSGSIVND